MDYLEFCWAELCLGEIVPLVAVVGVHKEQTLKFCIFGKGLYELTS
jgi:hypothetical protein